MTTEEKRIYIDEECHKYPRCSDGCPLRDERGRCMAIGLEDMTEDEVNERYNLIFPTTTIRDSGERREFETGAVRDIQEGKGRCDLMPLDVVALVNGCGEESHIIRCLADFQEDGMIIHLCGVLEIFAELHYANNIPTMFLEVAKHFEDGAKKYGEHNWQKGIPVHCYIDSAIRHYLKWLRGDKDEPHDRAFVWNILCCIWTCKHKPELNEYRGDNDEN